MDNMFCFQCEQVAECSGCTISGVCGKKPDTALSQDMLTCEMIALAKVGKTDAHVDLIVDGLFTTVTNVNFDTRNVLRLAGRIRQERINLGGDDAVNLGDIDIMNPGTLYHGDEDIVSLRSTLLFGLRGMAAYAHHARILGKRDEKVDNWFLKGMSALADEHSLEDWLDLLMEFGGINLTCMALLDEANTGTYGTPTPVQVPLLIEKGPFIVISGHDLYDLKMLLEQTDGKGVNVYTHCEMLPAHAYPELRRHPQLKGNFGTAWQTQQKEFDGIPAPVLFTTNCLMPPKGSYADRVYTTSVVAYPQLKHISADENGCKDFSEIIAHSVKLGGYSDATQLTGINGGTVVTTGFGRQTILDNAGTIVDAVKAGEIRHFFLVGGCDGAKSGRNFYTDFVKQTPDSTVVLTLGCGKYRFNDLDIGNIGPFPRILDMGQCNDAYGAIQAAAALSDAFGCGLNELPLTLVLSWFEQKAVCILLTLLSLGLRNIYIGPSIPIFFSKKVLSILVEKFDIRPITTPAQDLAIILEK